MFLEVFIITVMIELITILCRVKFGSKKERISQKGRKVRVHHSYIGLGLVGASVVFISNMLLIVGAALVLSDMMHHFVILPLWVQKTEFP